MAKYIAPKATKRRSEAMRQLYEQALMGANNVASTEPDFYNFVERDAQADADFLKNRTEFDKAIDNLYSTIGVENPDVSKIDTAGIDNTAVNNGTGVGVEDVVEDATAGSKATKIPGTLKELGAKALGFAKAHPYKAGGAAILGGINTAGLFDNSEIAGQAIGGIAGGVVPALMGANPYTAAMISMGGGALGSLYDKLVAKKKAEEVVQQQMYNEQGQY